MRKNNEKEMYVGSPERRVSLVMKMLKQVQIPTSVTLDKLLELHSDDKFLRPCIYQSV